MKLPWVLWKAWEFEAPTRRGFLKWAWALLVPKPPIDVWGIMEWVWSLRDSNWLDIIQKIISSYNYIQDLSDEVDDRMEDGWYLLELLEQDSWKVDVINLVLSESWKSWIPKLKWTSEDDVKEWLWWIHQEWILDFITHRGFYLWELNEELQWRVQIESSTVWLHSHTLGDMLSEIEKWNAQWAIEVLRDNDVISNLLAIDLWKWERITIVSKPWIWESFRLEIFSGYWSDFSMKWMKDEIIWKLNTYSIDELREKVKIIKKETRQKTREKIQQNKQLPFLQSEFSVLMNQILAWEIEITDEVRQRVWVLLSS